MSGIRDLYIAGLSTEYGVKATVVDALSYTKLDDFDKDPCIESYTGPDGTCAGITNIKDEYKSNIISFTNIIISLNH